jgi:hypothetical protein
MINVRPPPPVFFYTGWYSPLKERVACDIIPSCISVHSIKRSVLLYCNNGLHDAIRWCPCASLSVTSWRLMVEWRLATRFLNFGSGWVSGQLHAPVSISAGKSPRNPLNWKPGGTSWACLDAVNKIVSFATWSSSLWPSHYMDWAVQTHGESKRYSRNGVFT